MARHPAYQQILELGPPVLPLLLRDLTHRPEHWFLALHALTGANPVASEDRGNLRAMAAAWIAWGHAAGYL
jgi:hypothetical protein